MLGSAAEYRGKFVVSAVDQTSIPAAREAVLEGGCVALKHDDGACGGAAVGVPEPRCACRLGERCNGNAQPALGRGRRAHSALLQPWRQNLVHAMQGNTAKKGLPIRASPNV